MSEWRNYRYFVYNGVSRVGELQNVTSDFKYYQAINTAGAELMITIGNTLADLGAELAIENLIDELSNFIVDENGNNILVSSSYEFNNIPLDLANRIKVYREDQDHPNGVVVFDGLIISFHGSHLENTIDIRVVSWGIQLNNYLVMAGVSGTAAVQETSDIEYAATVALTGDKDTPEPVNTLSQTFTLAIDTVVPSVTVTCRVDSYEAFTSLSLIGGTPASPGETYGTVSGFMGRTEVTNVTFIFNSPLQLVAGTYHWSIQNHGYDNFQTPILYVSANSAGGYAGGTLLNDLVDTGDDAKFAVNSNNGETNTSFDQSDPGNIVRNIVSQMVSQGATVTYDNTSVDLTGVSVDYDFILATALEGVEKSKELAPSHWYWYVDVTDNKVHFHARSDTPDHIFKLGTHINDLDFGFSIEEVKNTVYFSGGDTGSGQNLLITDQNPSSQAAYGQWLARISDNRVTQAATAQSIVDGILNQVANLTFRSRLSVPYGVYDINSVHVGQMVGFTNFNNLIDGLVLQITAIDRTPDLITLDLDSVPNRVSREIEDTRRRLIAQETVDNPSAPS